jgi:hypothetical protein
MRLRSDKSAVTLVELILAVLLLNVIIMTGLSMELGIRRIFISADQEITLMDEAIPIVTLVAGDIIQGIGDVANATHSPYRTWVSGGGRTHYTIVRKVNGTGAWDTLDNASAIDYSFRSSTNTLERTNNLSSANYVELSDRVVNFSISAPANGVSTIFLQLRKDPAAATNVTNPEISLRYGAHYRGYSLN